MVRGSSNGDSNEHLRRRIWHTTFDETTRCSLAGNKAVNVWRTMTLAGSKTTKTRLLKRRHRTKRLVDSSVPL